MPLKKDSSSKKNRDVIENTVIIVVTFVWAVTFLLDPFLDRFTPRPEVGFIMAAIVGALWGIKVFRRNGL